ncbi:Uma2 family endonuclease [Streptomyces sp. NPDC048436]|uniref:Uma2 family endonuclease n=1 Tax=Streptomyces sp. NPDC048436 TaxID=3365550 RepID=UPI0037103748
MAGPAHHPIPVRRGHLREAAESIEQATGMRVEIIGGTLVMSPSPSAKHAGIVIDLRDAIRPALTAAQEAFENVSVPMPDDPDDYATPDLTIGPRAFKDDDGWLLDADAVELAVEVISPNERLKGINEKTAWYAAAGVPRLLQIDPRTGTWSLFTLPAEEPAGLGADLDTTGLPLYRPSASEWGTPGASLSP